MIEFLVGPKTECSRDDLGALGLKLGMENKEHAPISMGSLENLMPTTSASRMSQLGRIG